jgi:hypothetical protein
VEQLAAIKHQFDNQPKYASLESEITEIELVLRLMESSEGWNLVKESARMRTWYRNEEGNPIHSIKIEATLDAPLFNILAIINEVDLYVDWVPFLKISRETLVLSKYRRGAFFHFGLPWPLSDRDASIYAYGVDMLQDRNMMTVLVRSIGEGFGADGAGQTGGIYAQQLLDAAPASAAGAVRVDVRMSGGLLKPLSPTSTQLILIANANPQMAIIPYWLLNFVTKQLGGVLVSKLEGFAQDLDRNPTSKFRQRIAEKPRIYADIQARVNQVQHLTTPGETSS